MGLSMKYSNSYEDMKRAESYSKLEFPNTYYLAYRDIPNIIAEHVRGKNAIDFGCGTGRSTRFLQRHGFDVIGIDISKDMIAYAKAEDPYGDYRLIEDGDFSQFQECYYDLIFSGFTFDNIPDEKHRVKLLRCLASLINDSGKIILLDATPEIYTNEWASFSTRDFPENRYTKSGEKVRIIMTDVEDKRPVEDIIWFHEDYLKCFQSAHLELVKSYKPLGSQNEPYEWANETSIAPWVIYVLAK